MQPAPHMPYAPLAYQWIWPGCMTQPYNLAGANRPDIYLRRAWRKNPHVRAMGGYMVVILNNGQRINIRDKRK